MKRFLIVFVLIIFTLFISSCDMNDKIEELSKLYENNKNVFVFEGGITKENKSYYFVDLIAEEVKSSGRKVLNESFRTDQAYLTENSYYFVYQYYSHYNKKEGYSTQKFVTGYINITDLKINLIKYYDNGETVNIYKFGNRVVILDNKEGNIYEGENKIRTFNVNGYRGLKNYYNNQIILHKADNEYNYYWIIDSDLNDEIFTINKDTYLHYVDDDYIVYTKEGNYFGFDLNTDIEIDEVKLDELIAKVRNFKRNSFTYNEKIYTYNIEDEYENNHSEREYLIIESDDFKRIITVTMLREIVPEVKMIEEIFDTNIYFKELFFENDNIYISLVNDQSLFGFYSGHECIPIVLKYDLENDSFVYLGYYGAIFHYLVKVIEANNQL